MAHLIFIAKGRDVGMFRLTGLLQPLMLGRDVECDIYVPDVFVSRLHCRFEPLVSGEWALVDARSRNGIHFNGFRVFRRVLQHGDTIEVGSVAFQYDETDLPPSLSSPTPYGQGTSVAALVDTVFTEGLRPGDWIRRNQKTPAWVKAAEKAQARLRAEEEEAQAEAIALAERLDFREPTELDLEVQLARSAGYDDSTDEVELTPSYVLVPVELARRAYELAETAGAGSSGDGPADADLSALAALAPPASAATFAGRVNLWAEAEGAATTPGQSAAERKRPSKAEATGSSADSRTIGQSLVNFVNNVRGGYSLGDLRDAIAASPYRSAGVGAGIAAAIILASTVYLRRPAYKSPPRFNTDGSMNVAYIQGPGD